MTVLVTGAFGVVGTATVERLAADGNRVVVSGRDNPASRRAAARLSSKIGVCYADLTDAAAVERLVMGVAPTAIVHLAAVIPPDCYRNPALARAVNVDATRNLVAVARRQRSRPRFIYASTVSVHGPRNPHRHPTPLTVDSPVLPLDGYGADKWSGEQLVRSSGLDWVILRLGGVVSTTVSLGAESDAARFQGMLPVDGRIHTVHVRDAGRAFAAAVHVPCAGETFLVAGDDTHRMLHGNVGAAVAAAMGLADCLPPGRRGDPNSDTGWYSTDWMDVSGSEQVLGYQRYSWQALLEEIAANNCWKRPLLQLVRPAVRRRLAREAPYRNDPGSYADPWGGVHAEWGDPRPLRSNGAASPDTPTAQASPRLVVPDLAGVSAPVRATTRARPR